jgi:hypothetical protein
MEGLNGPLQYSLVAHTFPSFQRLPDKALAIEHKRVQLGEMNRKAITQRQGSSSIRLRHILPQRTLAHPGGGLRPAQYAPQGTPQIPHTRQAAPHWNPDETCRTEYRHHMLQVWSGWALCKCLSDEES